MTLTGIFTPGEGESESDISYLIETFDMVLKENLIGIPRIRAFHFAAACTPNI